MPAQSTAQRRLMGMALAYKRGELDSQYASDEVKKLADSMSEKDLEKFAKTKEDDLPHYTEGFKRKKTLLKTLFEEVARLQEAKTVRILNTSTKLNFAQPEKNDFAVDWLKRTDMYFYISQNQDPRKSNQLRVIAGSKGANFLVGDRIQSGAYQGMIIDILWGKELKSKSSKYKTLPLFVLK